MVGLSGFQYAGTNGANRDAEAVPVGKDKPKAEEIGGPSLEEGSLRSSVGSNEDDSAPIEVGGYDITAPPKSIKMADGQSYAAMSDRQKYAMHMASHSLERASELLVELAASGLLQGFKLDNAIDARWYVNDTDRGVWKEEMNDDIAARGRYTSGENIQFYGNRMLRHLPSGVGIPEQNAIERMSRGYSVSGLSAGLETFDYIAVHEVFHLMSYGAGRSEFRRESLADIVYNKIRMRFEYDR